MGFYGVVLGFCWPGIGGLALPGGYFGFIANYYLKSP